MAENAQNQNIRIRLEFRIPEEKRKECLELFEQGNGYKRTATITGLNTYTVRDYRRKYASGDTSWAYGMK